jgi:hypothetical protein
MGHVVLLCDGACSVAVWWGMMLISIIKSHCRENAVNSPTTNEHLCTADQHYKQNNTKLIRKRHPRVSTLSMQPSKCTCANQTSLCTSRLQYKKHAQLMIWRWPSQNTFGMRTVLYWTVSAGTQCGVSINVWRVVGDTLNITCNFLYCNHQVHRDFLITLFKTSLSLFNINQPMTDDQFNFSYFWLSSARFEQRTLAGYNTKLILHSYDRASWQISLQ